MQINFDVQNIFKIILQRSFYDYKNPIPSINIKINFKTKNIKSNETTNFQYFQSFAWPSILP